MTRVSATYLGLAAVAALAIALAVGRGGGAARAANDPPLRTTTGAVATDNPVASRVGAAVLARGGNAADAAAAAAFALGVINPASSGIGGGGFAVVYDASTHTLSAIDFREVAPAALTPDRFVRDGALQPQLARRGGLSVGVPGEVAGLERLVREHGRLSFRAAVAPAEALAQRGFPTPYFLAHAGDAVADRLTPGSELERWLRPGGAPLAAGTPVRRPRLADTLARIGRDGAAGFYRGPIARDVAAAVQSGGGVMTVKDLADYRAVDREPLVGSWRGYRVATMPLPSSGGLAMLEALGVIHGSGQDLAALGQGSSASYHLIAQALEDAFADRARFLGDADPARTMRGALLDPARLARMGKRLRPDRVLPHDQYGDASLGAGRPPKTDGGTSHLCVIDADGNAVALTTTVNGYFGSNILTPESGVVLNDQMDDFSLRAGVPNMFGLVQSDYNLVGPGKRPLSSMSPTLILQGDRVVGCAGGSGGPRIISNTLQVILDHFVYGMDARAAVGAPRIHHQWVPEKLIVEDGIPADVLENLRRLGYHVEVVFWRERPTAVQAIFVDADGAMEAASDPRKRGAPAAAR